MKVPGALLGRGCYMKEGVWANKTVNDLRNDGYHSYSASLNDNGLVSLTYVYLSLDEVIVKFRANFALRYPPHQETLISDEFQVLQDIFQ